MVRGKIVTGLLHCNRNVDEEKTEVTSFISSYRPREAYDGLEVQKLDRGLI